MKKSVRALFAKLSEQPKNWKRSLFLIWAASKSYTVLWAILLVVLGVLPGLLVFLSKLVVDSLVAALNSEGNWEKIAPSLFFVGATVLTILCIDIAGALLEMVRTAQADIIQDYVKSLIHDKSAVTDLADFESPDYHDRLEQATSDGASRPLSLLENIGGLAQNSITIIIVAGLLTPYSWWLPIVLLVSTVPLFVIVLRYDREYHRWWRRTTSTRRWINYFDIMLTHPLAVAEVRVFNLNPYFQAKYQKLRRDLRSEKLSRMRKLGLAKILAGIVSLVFLGASVAWMGWRAMLGNLTLGDLALFYQAFSKAQGLMGTVLGSLGKIVKDSLFLTVLFEYLDLKSNIADPEVPVVPPQNLTHGIQIRNVTFRYPGTERFVFRNFSLFFPAGKTIAIVGENGSGKTTLLKLICRFYDPDSGQIEFDGIDTRKFSVAALLRMITITFQQPLNYHSTINESIAMGDIQASRSPEDMVRAATSAGAHGFIERLPNGYDTLLGKVHGDGVELSGGEWQRLALARTYFRQSPVVLLDEPTSFMDSWSEDDWFQRFRNLISNRTAIIITHRFTIAMRADFIHVMSDGAIVESGNHRELLEMNGFYAKSWKSQMQSAEDVIASGI